jgi:hypothetical protein
MKKKLAICFASAMTIFAGGSYLATPVAAAEESTSGCTLEQYSAAIRYAHDDCRAAGFDGGTVVSCGDWGSSAECWNL